MSSTSAAPLRSWIVRITIASFSLAALMGVVALLSGGEFGETEGRVLLTTLVVGTVSVLVLCYLATADTAYRAVGVVGGVVVLAPLSTSLYLIWASLDTDAPEVVAKTFGLGSILAATLAQACLLLAVGSGRSRTVGRLLAATLVLAAGLAGLTSALVLGLEVHGSGYFRLLGVVAILDVLGTVVVSALAKFGAHAPRPASGQLVVPSDLAARVVHRAAATGREPDDVLREALEAQLAPADRP